MIAVLVAQMIVGVAETFYIGRLGTDALAGAALVFPLSMLMTMMSNGGIGGGVASAIARTTGAGRHKDADALLLHALVLAVIFGTAFVAAALFLGPRLYSGVGGRVEVLAVAVTYSDYVFAASVPIWIVNLMAAALRGVGNVRVPAAVTLAGSVILIPLSPLLIFGFGPLPSFGVAGAGIAIMIYYVGAAIYLGFYLRSGRGGLTLRLSALRWDLFASILGVGLISALAVVIVVSLLSLGWRVGIVVAAAILLTLCAVFVVMMMTGRDFDRITLGTLIISAPSASRVQRVRGVGRGLWTSGMMQDTARMIGATKGAARARSGGCRGEV